MNKLYLNNLLLMFTLCSLSMSCSSHKYFQTVDRVELDKFMGDWYVLAFRPTFLEREAYNALENYSFDEKTEEIKISYTFNAGAFDGKKKSIPQKGWVVNKETNAHWKVSPLWPLRFDYLVVALGENYEWTVIGVPNGKYLWLMARSPKMSETEIREILGQVDQNGYPAKEFRLVKHK